MMNSNSSRVKYFITVFLLLAGVAMHAQDIDARSPKPAVSSHKQKTAEKKKAVQEKKMAKAVEMGKKRHLKIQKKNTRKMMKEAKHKSKLRNEHKREFFLKRWFTRKRP